MTFPPTRNGRTLEQAPARRRDDSGLTTLEWLLIVAAVAGMAALAVVLVTRVVGDTSEQIAGQSARRTAALFAAQQIINDAARNADEQPRGAKTYEDWAAHYTDKCKRLDLAYVDIELKATPNFKYFNGAPTEDDTQVAEGNIDSSRNPEADPPAAADLPSKAGDKAIAHCKV